MAVILADSSGNKYSVSVDATQTPPALSIVAVSSTLSTSPDGTFMADASGGTWKVIVAADGSLSLAAVPGAVVPTGYISSVTQDMIASALRLINVLASGELPKPNEASDALMVLNQMIDAWNADHLAVFTTSIYEFGFTAGKQTYTLGDGGDFNMQRPASIDGMSVIILDNPANPIEVPLVMYSTEQWQTQVPVKATNSTFPQIVYDDGNFPLRSLSFWGIPTVSSNHVRIYAWQQLPTQSLTSAIALPPGYAEAFRYNLAVRLAAEFAQPLTPTVQQIAVESLARIKTMNAPDLSLKSDLARPDNAWNYRQQMFGIPY